LDNGDEWALGAWFLSVAAIPGCPEQDLLMSATTFAAPASLLTSSTPTTTPGFVTGAPKWLLRAEGLALLLVAVAGYRFLLGGWGAFAACFFLPDLSLLGYFSGARVGAVVYNVGHSLLGPTVVGALAVLLGSTGLGLAALIWVAHIGFDRFAGYGLKYDRSFFDTHLGRVGRAEA
jgi:hypothetical protein